MVIATRLALGVATAWLIAACADHSRARTVIDAGDATMDALDAAPETGLAFDATDDEDASVDCSIAPHDTGEVEPDRSEILQLPQGEGLLDQCSRAVPSPIDAFWVPSEADVLVLETALASHFREPCVRHYWITLDEHYVQYIGIVSEGRRLIYASFVHQSAYLPSTLTPTPAYVLCDGGELAWGIVFDPNTSRFEQLSVNGSFGG